MRLVFGLVLLLGLGLAGFAVYMARDFVSAYQVELANERKVRDQIVPTVEVAVVNRQLRYGERLRPDDVRFVRWPEDAIPEGAFTSLDSIFPDGDEELRSILRTTEKDEAILQVKVTRPGQDAGVGSRLAPGMRAFAIRTDVTSGVSGFLRPGDRVDVYWTGRPPGSGTDVTKLIDTNVRLIAVDQSADEDRNSPIVARTVTVQVSPAQAGALAQAQATGRLSLSLVGVEDETIAETIEIDQKDLLGIEEQVVVEAEPERICTITTRRGGESVQVPIQCQD